MTSKFGPIECHHLVSFYPKKRQFDPVRVRLIKSHFKHDPLAATIPGCFLDLLDIKFRHVALCCPAKMKGNSNLDYRSEAHLTEIGHLENLLRRGLGYRIIFNMGGKVYNPEDPSTLPDLVFVVTDFFGTVEKGRLSASHIYWKDEAQRHSDFFRELSGSYTLEVTYTFDRVVIVRDGTEELVISQFDKLLSPEQLKIYNKYASVLGRYLTIADSAVKAKRTQTVFLRFKKSVEIMSDWMNAQPYPPPKEGVFKTVVQRLKFMAQNFLKHVALPIWSLSRAGSQLEKQDLHWKNEMEQLKDPREVIDAIESNFEQSKYLYFARLPQFLKQNWLFLLHKYPKCVLPAMHAHLEELTPEERHAAQGMFSSVGPSSMSAVFVNYFKDSTLGRVSISRQVESSSTVYQGEKYTAAVLDSILNLKHRDYSGSWELELPIPYEWFESDASSITPIESMQLFHRDISQRSIELAGQSNPSPQEIESDERVQEPCEALLRYSDIPEETADPEDASEVEELAENEKEFATWTPCKTFDRQYSFQMVPLTAQKILLTNDIDCDNKKVEVDLDSLYALKDWKQRGWSVEQVWSQCSRNIERPPLLPNHVRRGFGVDHLSRTAMVHLCCEEQTPGTGSFGFESEREVLHFLYLPTPLKNREWISVIILPEYRLSADTDGTPKAVYYSERNRLIFTANCLRMSDHKLAAYAVDRSTKTIEKRASLLLETTQSSNDHMPRLMSSGESLVYWIEKKGRVFFYCVQSSPEISVYTTVYHQRAFVPVGRNQFRHVLPSTYQLDAVLCGRATVGAVFQNKSHPNPDDQQNWFRFFQLTPQF